MKIHKTVTCSDHDNVATTEKYAFKNALVVLVPLLHTAN